MSWFNFGKKKEERSADARPITYEDVYGISGGFSIFKQHNSFALSLSAVYSAVELISNSIALLPIQVKFKDDKGEAQINNDHELNLAFNNNDMSKYMIIKMMVADMLLFGNGYALIERSGGHVTGIRYLEANDVQVQWDKYKKKLYYTCNTVAGKVIQPENILHIYKNSRDGHTGIGVLKYAARTIDLANYTENSSLDFFAKGLNVTGIIHAKQPMNKMQAQQALNSIEGNVNADKAYYKFLPFDIDFQPLTQNAKDAQMIETRLFNVSEIARFFNISPVLLQDLSKSSYSTVEAANLQFLTQTLLPYISIIESEFNRKLVGEENIFIDLDEREFLRTDSQSTANYYVTLVNAGILSRNEVREQLGYNKVEGADELAIPYTNTEQNTFGDKSEEEKDTDEKPEDKEEKQPAKRGRKPKSAESK